MQAWKGVWSCEVQQNSDMTYRRYDFDRLVDGKLWDLHLDKAMEVIDYENTPQVSTDETRKSVKIDGGLKQEIVRDRYFNIDKLLLEGSHRGLDGDSFMTYSILEGEGDLHCDGIVYPIKKGDTWYIPPKLEVSVEGKLEILNTFL